MQQSPLFNALTEAGVLESARMFATLDPKLRQLQLPSRRRILLSDTVGFIRNLPHTLVTSFRATLEEVQRAEILLHIQDAASPVREEQKAQVEKVLAELAVSIKPLSLRRLYASHHPIGGDGHDRGHFNGRLESDLIDICATFEPSAADIFCIHYSNVELDFRCFGRWLELRHRIHTRHRVEGSYSCHG
jgi:hypothetical protein